MKNVQNALRKVLVPLNHFVHRIVLLIAQISMMAMVAIVTLTVVLRYCFNTGLSWAEEVPRLLVTLFAFIACAIGVRDHLHVAVNAVYNQLPVGGKALDVLTDVVVLLCGLFMLYTGGARTMKLFSMPGTLPITGISTAWLLFLTGIVSRDDLLYSEKEIDYTDVAALKEMEKKEDEHK